MSAPTTSPALARAHTTGPAADAVAAVVAELRRGLDGRTAAVVCWFASSAYDPADLAGPLAGAFPEAQVLGCSTAGEFTDAATGTGGLSAIALPTDVVTRVHAGLGDLSGGVVEGTDDAVAAVQAGFGTPLRDLDATNHLGLVLIDGMHAAEEAVNSRLGDAAPLLGVVGGSAGDDLAFSATWVALGGEVSWNGVVFAVAEVAVPFHVVKTCSFVPSGRTLRITKANTATRTVVEFDGVPAVQAYAAALGTTADQVDSSLFMSHPVGMMFDGEPWIRSPQTVTDEGLRFYAEILEGTEVEIMDSTDLVGDTAAAVRDAVAAVGGHASGALMFNCILRRLELDAKDAGQAFVEAFDGVPTCGFHTYGETYLGHVNQTLTGVVFG